MRLTHGSLLFVLLALAACPNRQPAKERVVGQTSYLSTPPAGASRGSTVPGVMGGYAANGADDQTAGKTDAPSSTTPRTVQETDLYRLEGNRLYYLNSYRGLMVFDVTDVDSPKLLGRSPIFGSPVDMVVQNGVAIVVVGDWYGRMDDGTPFHGSIVRGLDATDPTNIKVIGEAQLGGWVQDDRVVGSVLYAVSQDWGWSYGWLDDGSGTSSSQQDTVIVSSVSFAGGTVQAVSKQVFTGYSGIFNVTPNAIMLAHAIEPAGYPNQTSGPAQTELLYLDISDPAGAIVRRGSLVVDGQAQGWGADNGRWNLDFADGKTAHVIGCTGQYYWCDGSSGYVLSTADFSDPDAPVLKSALSIPTPGWSVAARFADARLYLSPGEDYGTGTSTPFQVYDLTDPAAPALAGTLQIPGSVWNILPAPNERLFALGNDWGQSNNGDSVSLKYLNVTDPSAPALLGTSTFGQGWAWTPAAGTFKAFTMDATKALVVLPFSGWDYNSDTYNNGLQLIEFNADSERTAGAAHTKGWVERGIFVQDRLVSLSDLALAVVDYSNHDAPTVTASLTLARNVVAAQPAGQTIAEISSDWWGNDDTNSEVRVLPIGSATETTDVPQALTVSVPGVGARVFMNGDLAYVVTNVRTSAPCPGGWTGGTCWARAEQVQVVDVSGGTARLRGTVQLPDDTWGWYGWGWWGFWWYDWYWGPEVVQVGSDALAFRRWEPVYAADGTYLDENSLLYVVDLSNADQPSLASVTITTDPDGWWGNLRVVGQTLYTTHYEWTEQPSGSSDPGTVEYFVDRIDLTDRAHPAIGSKVNVPGVLVGGFDQDPSLLLFIDYRWDSGLDKATNEFSVCRLSGGACELQSQLALDGWAGQTFVQGTNVYLSTEQYDWSSATGPRMQLHAIDLSDPAAPVDRVASGSGGWGWLLGVQGDRAIVSSGWGWDGVDIYQLIDGQAPQYSQFARTSGWWVDGVSRQGDSLYFASGYWGVQQVDLH